MLTVLSLLSPLFSGVAMADAITIDTGVVIEGSLARYSADGDCQIAVAEGALRGATLTLPCARVVHFDRKIPDFQPMSQAPMQVEDLDAPAALVEVAPAEVASVEPAPVEPAPAEITPAEITPEEPALVEVAPEEPASAGLASGASGFDAPVALVPEAPAMAPTVVPLTPGRVPSPPRVGTRREVEPIPVPVPSTSLTW